MSHIGLYVHDLARMEDFYTRVLGFTVTDRGKVRGADIVFTSWDPKDHHQVALVSGRPKDLAFNHINQISFRVACVEDLQAIWQRVKDEPGVPICGRWITAMPGRSTSAIPKAIGWKCSATPTGTLSNPASRTSISRSRPSRSAPSPRPFAEPRPASSRSNNTSGTRRKDGLAEILAQ